MSAFRSIVAVLLLCSAEQAPQDNAVQTGRLHLIVPDLASDDGKVLFFIHERATFVKKNLSKREGGVCIATGSVEIVGRRATWTSDPLPYGEYAIIVHHDVNGDGIVNFGTVLPTEPIGYSNYDRAIAAYPEFDTARIALRELVHEISIEAYMQGRIFRRQLKE